MTLAQLIAQLRGQVTAKLESRNEKAAALAELRTAETVDEVAVTELRSAKDALDAEIDALQSRIADLEAEQARDDAADRLSREVLPGAPRPKYDEVARVGAAERTYRADGDRFGVSFLRDVAASAFGDFDASQRLSRHMSEERVERGEYLSRAVATSAFTGLVVPQYLTDMYAPAAKALRPFADNCNIHPLPADGMTVNISRITTASSTAIQTENAAVSETNMDDTLLSPAVQTAAGQQTVSRQAVERGTGIEEVVLDDLFRSYATTLDSTLINQATNGLTNVATAVTYTDASPTAAELYPKILAAQSGAEAALLGQAIPDLAVMHSRRWAWMQSQVGSTWPFIGQQMFAAQSGGAATGEGYGSGVRGYLPAGLKVIVDNNIATNLGGGTEDEIYVVASSECHLWEDPQAPVFIRAEQTSAASLGVLFVVYGYFAYTFARYTNGAQKVSGTGLVTPTFA